MAYKFKEKKTPPKELTELRNRLNKIAKKEGRGFYTRVANDTNMSNVHISLFKDGKKSVSIENFFILKEFIDTFELKSSKN